MEARFSLLVRCDKRTGFGFPFQSPSASHILGIMSLVVLVVGDLARTPFTLVGAWR